MRLPAAKQMTKGAYIAKTDSRRNLIQNLAARPSSLAPPPPLPPAAAAAAAAVDKDERSFGGIVILGVGRRSSDDL